MVSVLAFVTGSGSGYVLPEESQDTNAHGFAVGVLGHAGRSPQKGDPCRTRTCNPRMRPRLFRVYGDLLRRKVTLEILHL